MLPSATPVDYVTLGPTMRAVLLRPPDPSTAGRGLIECEVVAGSGSEAERR